MEIKLILPVYLFVISGALAQTDTLRIYGPGGPYGPMKECAMQFGKTYNVQVSVMAGPETVWIDNAQENSDIIFGGAEYMLSQFNFRHPELLNNGTRTTLYTRPSGVLVRPGNPKKLEKAEDLFRDDVKILVVSGAGQTGLWEDMFGKTDQLQEVFLNIYKVAYNGKNAIELWKQHPEIDAWITWESWHYRLQGITELVKLSEKYTIYRGTPVAVTKQTENKVLAEKFIAYLKSSDAREIFEKWGWR